MIDPQPTPESLHRRIRRLELTNRLFGVGTLTILLLGGAAVSMGYVSDEPKAIEVSSLSAICASLNSSTWAIRKSGMKG